MRGIDYHRLYFRHRFFPSIFVVLSTLQGLETHRERPVSSFFLFSFPFFPLLPLDFFSICIEMKTYLFGGLRPKSLPFCLWPSREWTFLVLANSYTYLRERVSFSPSTFALYPVPLTFFRLEDGTNNEEAAGNFTLRHSQRSNVFERIDVIFVISTTVLLPSRVVTCFDRINRLSFNYIFILLKIYQKFISFCSKSHESSIINSNLKS